MTLQKAIKIAKQRLPKELSAAKETILLYSKKSGKDMAYLLANDDIEISDDTFFDFLDKRASHYPFEYITNSVEFCDLELFVDERVLIPRPESELLVDKALWLIDSFELSSLLDICTGSGAIMLAIKSRRPALSVAASDISRDALCVAKQNAASLNLDAQFFHSDLFLQINKNDFDIITANPPYIQNGYNLETNVLYEPHTALFGGEVGHELLFRVIDGFFKLKSKALVCEIGFDQKSVLESKISSYKDISYGFYTDFAGFDRGFWIIKDNK